MEVNSVIAVKFLGWALLLIIISVSVCSLAYIGYNTYIKYEDEHKKIEVHTQDSNFSNSDHR